MSDDVADRAEAALQGISDGPWEQNGNNGVHTTHGECVATTVGHHLLPNGKPVRKANAEFIAAARSLLPELVAELKTARERIAAFEVGQGNAGVLLGRAAEDYDAVVAELKTTRAQLAALQKPKPEKHPIGRCGDPSCGGDW